MSRRSREPRERSAKAGARMVLARLAGIFGSRRRDAELDEEMQTHLALLADEHERRGLTREAAEQAARRDLGGVVRTREAYREQRGFRFVESLMQDVRYALRMWRHSPGFNLAIVAILTFGTGANSAMFTFVDALLLRKLPGRGDELVGIYSHDPAKERAYRNFSYPNYVDIRDRGDMFEHVIAFNFSSSIGREVGDLTEQPLGVLVSENYFRALGIRLAAGRAFTAEESRPGAGIPVVIVNYANWERTGFDPAFIGSTTRLNSTDFTIVGVAPKSFTGTMALIAPELWLPLGTADRFNGDGKRGWMANRATPSLMLAGIRKPGLSLEETNARLAPLAEGLAREYPAENKGYLLSVGRRSRVNVSGAPSTDAGPTAMASALMPLAGGVLLVACLNIATMLLARGTARRKEIAIRLALGGGRARIVRQLFTENLMLAGAGATLGLAAGTWITQMILAAAAPVFPVPIEVPAAPDRYIVFATIAFTLFSALAFGLAPALKMTRADLTSDLKDTGAAMTGRGARFRRRAWPVVCQIAVSLALLTAGGFCARAVLRAAVMDPGYSYDRLLRVSIDPALASYDKARQHERVETSLARLRAMPGVVSAAAATRVAFSYSQESRRVVRPGRSDVARQEPYFAGVSSDHFRTLGLPILHGREFTPAEDAAGSQPRVAIIDEPLAQRLFGNENPIGQTIASPVDDEDPLAENNAPLEIVGVVAGVREDLTSHAPVLHLYVPTPLFSTGNMHLLVRTHGGSDGEMLTALRREIRRVDDKMPVTELTTMRDDHAQNGTLWLMRTAANTLSALGALALVLAAVGLYGVKAFNVAQRTREIGVRLALGARPREIAIMLLRDDVKVTLLGVALGLPMAVALGHLFSSAMFQLDVYDPLILVAAPLVLIACAALATYLPARRAMRVSPLTALRHE